MLQSTGHKCWLCLALTPPTAKWHEITDNSKIYSQRKNTPPHGTMYIPWV